MSPNQNQIEATPFGSPNLPMLALDRFFAHAAAVPDKLAAVDLTTSYTYSALADRALALAAWMTTYRVAEGARVGLYTRRSADALAAIIAINSCGAAYVPLERSVPLDRIAFMARDAGVEVIVTDDTELYADADWLPAGVTILQLVGPSGGSEQRLAVPKQHAFANNLAYLIYTSGSTGKPKGVPITQRNLSYLMRSWDHVMDPTRPLCDEGLAEPTSHRTLQLSSLGFDASMTEYWWPLAAGGTVVVATDSGSSIGVAVGELIRRFGVTHLQCTPTRATLLLADDDDRAALGTVQHVVIGGEALPLPLARRLSDAGIQRLTNAYGPTECTVWATTAEVPLHDTDFLARSGVMSLGEPLRDISLFVRNEAGETTPLDRAADCSGELVIGGPFVSSGYLNRPELTTSSFLTLAHASEQIRAYRTGDLVRRETNGPLEYLGRTDHQIKIRGHRIELGEIEATIASHPDVQHVAVIQHPKRPDELVAFVVANGDRVNGNRVNGNRVNGNRVNGNRVTGDSGGIADKGTFNPRELESFVGDQLLPVMVPRRYISVDRFVMTASGKIDRQHLAQSLSQEILSPEGHDGDSNGATLATSSPTYETPGDAVRLMGADFAAVLGRARVRSTDDFFAMGGHSLSAVELTERIHDRTGKRLSIRTLLDAPTPAELAELIDKQDDARQGQCANEVLVRFGDQRNDARRMDGRNRKLFLIHGAGGNVLRYRTTALNLADLVELVGVQARGADGTTPPDADLETMVQRYADAIESDQRTGALELGGYSSGGLIALHTAALLVQRGRSIRSVVLVDSFADEFVPKNPLRKLRALLHNTRDTDGLSAPRFVEGAWAGWKLRRQWDEDGLKSLAHLGFRDLYDHTVALVAKGGRAPLVDAPALLIRSAVENPFRIRDYDECLMCPSSVTPGWVFAKHDELFTDPTNAEIESLLRQFLRRV